MKRVLVTVLGMLVISSGTYFALGRFSTKAAPAAAPTATTPSFSLPGTIFLAQHGAIYTVSKGAVGKLNLPAATFWSHPAVTADGAELALAGGDSRFTDLYLVSPKGQIERRLTDDAAKEVDQNHWAFYPRFTSNGAAVFYSWDPKNRANTFRVDLAIYSLDVKASTSPPGTQWTVPDELTGGDVSPQPLAGGGLLYSGYSAGPNLQVDSRIWLQAEPGVAGKALTEAAANCGRPAVSPAGDEVAMICSPTPEKANLVVAPFKDGAIGPAVLTIDDQVAAAPTWAPDGTGIAYLAPGKAGPGFDLWWLPLVATAPLAATASPTGATSPASSPASSPGAGVAPGRRQVTNGLDADATSAPAWSPL